MGIKRIILIAGLIMSTLVYGWFIRTIFVKTYPFNGLAEDGKKQILYSENAFYYSFYERLAKTTNWVEEVNRLKSDNSVQYPEKINVFSKYNIGPEILGAMLFRISQGWVGVDAFDFYTGYVISIAALGAGVLYLLAYEVTGSIVGGIMAVLFVLFSYPWSTRLVSGPALRENFGIPTLLFQVYLMIIFIKVRSKKYWWLLVVATILHILFWQFSTYTLLTEIVVLSVVSIMENDKKKICNVLVLIITMVLLKIFMGGVGGNSHVLEYFRFQLFKTVPNFHVMMYHCNGGFEMINRTILKPLFNNLLLVMVGLGWLGVFFIKGNESTKYRLIAILGLGYLALCIIASRFVVLAIPFLAVVAVMVFSEKYWWDNILGKKNRKIRLAVSGGILLLIIVNWLTDGNNELLKSIRRQGNNPYVPMIEPYKWIMENTDSNSVFGASMPLTSKILLLTGRKIANNPFYEDVNSRQKTLEIYRMYGRESEGGMYEIALKNGLNYLVIERQRCFERSNNGCLAEDLYVTEDKGKTDPLLCRVLGDEKSGYFEKVFENRDYRIFKVL
ncbi:MAG: hypothetical protein WC596_00815 [Candidatus Shapirobacteria bacterium]